MIRGDSKLLVCGAASIVAHLALAWAADRLPRHAEPARADKLAIRITAPPIREPVPEPLEPPRPPAPEPPAVKQPAPAPRSRPPTASRPSADRVPRVAEVAAPAPSPEPPAEFGVTIESTSSSGGPAVQVGRGGVGPRGGAPGGQAQGTPLGEPVAAFAATKLPLPDERCHDSLGKYTEAAQAAGTEGTVILDLVVGEDGRPRDIQVVRGLPNGLTDAATAALRACKFTPGERDGTVVPVKIRGFKIVFVLPDRPGAGG